MTVTARTIGWNLAAAITLFAGCGGPTHPAAMNAVELLDILEDDLKKHDPIEYAEVEIGKFGVTHVIRSSETTVTARFQLFAVLPAKRESEFSDALTQYQQRVRDSVIAMVQQADTEQLLDPSLASLKEEMVAAINRVTRKRLVKDVVFSEFMLEKS